MHSGALTFILALLSLTLELQIEASPVECDVVIAGGSTSALAASIAIARQNSLLHVCLLEPTDWPGGQLTSSAVSAVDFGPQDRFVENQAKDFAAMLGSLGTTNPGNCWVSLKCFEPTILLNKWIFPTLQSLPNVHVYLMTAVRDVVVKNRRITQLIAVQRSYKPGISRWNATFSEEVTDWYSTHPSAVFNKQQLTFSAPVFIEATEYGDVLVLSRAPFHQGIETPLETSQSTDSTCGQCMTFPFYMYVAPEPHPPQKIPPPPPDASYTMGDRYGFSQIWSYRRSLATAGPIHEARVHEVSNQNWGLPPGNDDDIGYMFLDTAATLKQRDSGQWAGGLNLTAISRAEALSYGWFSFMKNHSVPANLSAHMTLIEDTSETAAGAGTLTGLSKAPYVRDTRRSVGLDGFMLQYKDLAGEPDSKTGFKFTDRIAIGDYFYADTHRLSSCQYPAYLLNATIKPYFIPFRALTNDAYDNLLVSGKTMAQTFHANSATRLHPVEWSSGVAAGVAAALMVEHNVVSTREMYTERMDVLQQAIQEQAPLDWTLHDV